MRLAMRSPLRKTSWHQVVPSMKGVVVFVWKMKVKNIPMSTSLTWWSKESKATLLPHTRAKGVVVIRHVENVAHVMRRIAFVPVIAVVVSA